MVPRSIAPAPPDNYEPPISAVGLLFRQRLERIHICRTHFRLDINTRPTTRVLGGYYKSRRLVRIYSHDRAEGRRPWTSCSTRSCTRLPTISSTRSRTPSPPEDAGASPA